MPKISVILPVYNGLPYLESAINSILEQSFDDFEFLIIDDGSQDTGQDLIQTYPDPRIRLLKNEKNLGVQKTTNRGIQESRGEYIARMDADDISFFGCGASTSAQGCRLARGAEHRRRTTISK